MKYNKEIFDSNVFDLPKNRNQIDFYEFLKSEFEKFLALIKEFNKGVKKELRVYIPLIQDQIILILASVEAYNRGFPAESYKRLTTALNILVKERLLPITKAPIIDNKSNYYRIRVSENKSLSKSDLFHIPFHLREKVSTQRYSIPGLPCLYLGDSVFVCWEELGRPSFDNIHVARFDLSCSSFNFLYFNTSVKEIRERCFTRSLDGKFVNHLVQFLCYWPILTACSLVVSKPVDVFKPEYIVPQLLLQWLVRSKKIDGVIYKSNRVNISSHNVGTFANMVIPIKETDRYGFCPILSRTVKLTQPISWQLLDISDPKKEFPFRSSVDLEVDDLRRAMFIELIEGEKANYLKTKFGLLEEKLKNLTIGYL